MRQSGDIDFFRLIIDRKFDEFRKGNVSLRIFKYTECVINEGFDVDASLHIAVEVFGSGLVSYALGLSPERHFEDIANNETRAALATIAAEAQKIAEQPQNREREIRRASVLAPKEPVGSGGLISEVRKMAGLDLPEIASEDPVEQLLLECLRDYFPLLLMCSGPGAYKTGHLDGVPPCRLLRAGREVLDAILQDTQLRLLFPGSADSAKQGASSAESYVYWQSGQAHGITPEDIPDALVSETIYLAYVKGETSFARCADILRVLLSAARSLATGAATLVPSVVGLSNIRLDRSVSCIDLGTSKIYPGRVSVGFRLINEDFFSRGALMLTSRVDRITSISASPADRGGVDEIAAKVGEVDLSQSRLMKEIETVRLALLLASTDFPIAPVASSGTHINPLNKNLPGSVFFESLREPAVPLIVLLTEDTAKNAPQWRSLLDQRKMDTIAIGVRRLLSAVAMRTNDVDAFIDSVLFWENLFGEAIETAFKVCGAMAWLIEATDAEARKSTFRNLKRLYGVRSSVVHGSKDITETEAEEYRKQAISFSISAMRAVVLHPTLLSHKDANKRYLLMLMGFQEQ